MEAREDSVRGAEYMVKLWQRARHLRKQEIKSGRAAQGRQEKDKVGQGL